MKILYLHQYFRTPEEGGAIRSYHLAKALADKGFEVEMITAWNRKNYEIRQVAGVTVHYLPVFYANALPGSERIFSYLRFAWKAFFIALKIKKINICFATSTPLTVGLAVLGLKWFRRVPYFFEVRDLWPLAPIEMGFIRNEISQKILYFFEKTIYKNADKIVALSPGIVAYIENLNINKSVTLISNIADCGFFQPDTERNTAEIKQKFVITYTGTLGEANHLDYLLEAALYFQKQKTENVIFQIVGEGKEEKILKRKVLDYQLSNLFFLPACDKFLIRDILNNSDAIYISFAQKKVLETTSPNKFFDGLAAGKLIITNIKGWIACLIEKNNCGFYANPETPEDFFNKIQPYLSDKNLLQQAQTNARQLAENEFDKKILTEKFTALFQEVQGAVIDN
jgi:glycosyltransferase involved in cell wall biosynthesis